MTTVMSHYLRTNGSLVCLYVVPQSSVPRKDDFLNSGFIIFEFGMDIILYRFHCYTQRDILINYSGVASSVIERGEILIYSSSAFLIYFEKQLFFKICNNKDIKLRF